MKISKNINFLNLRGIILVSNVQKYYSSGKSYNYLKLHFNKEGTDDIDITTRINKTRKIIESLNLIYGARKWGNKRYITL